MAKSRHRNVFASACHANVSLFAVQCAPVEPEYLTLEAGLENEKRQSNCAVL